jgi:hypothetical protein
MSNLLEKSVRFQEDYNRYQSVISKMPDGNLKQEVNQLLNNLVSEIKKLDHRHMEMINSKQMASVGTEIKQDITTIRKQLELKIKDWQNH